MSITIPDSHKDLLERPIVVTLVTMNPDGQPQATPVWFSWDGEHILINTNKGRRKDRNMKARPQVAVLIIDPDNPYRWMELRGTVEGHTEEGGADHIDMLAKRYFGRDDDYEPYPERRAKKNRTIFKIKPNHVTYG